MRIEESTVDDLLHRALEETLAKGRRVKATRGWFLELIGPTFVLTNPRARLSRSESRGKVFSALGELLWYLSGDNKLAFIERYVPKYTKESPDGINVRSGYGNRIFNWRELNQITNVIELLKSRSTSRQAVIQIFDAEDVVSGDKSVPCTCTMQFLRRDEQLHLLVNMRSNDAYIGFSHDVFAFTMLQEIVARSVGVELGQYIHTAGSFHIYEDSVEAAKGYLAEGLQNIVPMEPMPEGDPWESIQRVKEFEGLVHENPVQELPNVPHYWQDVCRLLSIFSVAKAGGHEAILTCEKIAKEISCPGYEMFIETRLAKIRDDNAKT